MVTTVSIIGLSSGAIQVTFTSLVSLKRIIQYTYQQYFFQPITVYTLMNPFKYLYTTLGEE